MLDIEPVGAIDIIAILRIPLSLINLIVSSLNASSINGHCKYFSSSKIGDAPFSAAKHAEA